MDSRVRVVVSSLLDRVTAVLPSQVLADAPESLAGRVRMEQVQSILRMTPVMMGANIAIAFLVSLAGLTHPHRVGIGIWAALVISYALLGLRGWVSAQRRKTGKAGFPEADFAAHGNFAACQAFETAAGAPAQRAQHVLAGLGRAFIRVLGVHDRHSLSAISPRRIQDLMVPTGLARRAAICSCV